MSTEAGEEDQIVKAVKAVQELYKIQNTYFPKNPSERIDKLRSQLALALEFIDSIPLGNFHFSSNFNPISILVYFLFFLGLNQSLFTYVLLVSRPIITFIVILP